MWLNRLTRLIRFDLQAKYVRALTTLPELSICGLSQEVSEESVCTFLLYNLRVEIGRNAS